MAGPVGDILRVGVMTPDNLRNLDLLLVKLRDETKVRKRRPGLQPEISRRFIIVNLVYHYTVQLRQVTVNKIRLLRRG